MKKWGVISSMGLLRGEGTILRNKYMKKFGLSQEEAIEMVNKFIDELKDIKDKMKVKNKSEVEIELKLQTRFEEEFQRLCCE